MLVENDSIVVDGVNPEWLPNLYGRMDDRRDLKWWHPETRPVQAAATNREILDAISRFTDPTNPPEQRAAMRDAEVARMGVAFEAG